MTTKQFKSAVANRREYQKLQKLLERLQDGNISSIFIKTKNAKGLRQSIELDANDIDYLDAVSLSITHQALKDLKALDKEFDEL